MLKSTYEQINNMLGMVNEVIDHIREFNEDEYSYLMITLGSDLRYTVETVNKELFGSPEVCFCNLSQFGEELENWKYKRELIKECMVWRENIAKILNRRYTAKNVWEEKFIRLMDYARYVDFDAMVERTKESLLRLDTKEITRLCQYYQKYQEFWGTLDVPNDRYDVIRNRVAMLKEHREDFIWLYDQLGDWRSRLVLTSMLYNWVTFDSAYIVCMKEANYTDYFDLDLVVCGEEEVMVDMGAWNGDSALNFIQTYRRYKKIYCYEISEGSMENMKENLRTYADIEYRNKGVGDKNEWKYMDVEPKDSPCNKITEHDTGRKIEIVRLDDDIEEKVTLIKMDIEGSEQAALAGSIRHIQEEKPKLLISVYHNNEDIWKIPRMIKEMNPAYQLYLRSNGEQFGPSEIVLFAIDQSAK